MRLKIRQNNEQEYITFPVEALPVIRDNTMVIYLYYYIDTTSERDEIIAQVKDLIIDCDYIEEVSERRTLFGVTVKVPEKTKVIFHA